MLYKMRNLNYFKVYRWYINLWFCCINCFLT